MYDYLKTPEWEKQRKRVLQRDSYTCQICGRSGGELNVHHLFYVQPLCDMHERDLVTLCHDCHMLVHSIQDHMDAFADAEMRRLKVEWGKRMSEEINRAFPDGIAGLRKSRALSIINDTFYEQRKHGWAIRPDFTTLQREVRTKRKNEKESR